MPVDKEINESLYGAQYFWFCIILILNLSIKLIMILERLIAIRYMQSFKY